MKTFLTLLAVWLGLGLFAVALLLVRAWLHSKDDPDDAAEKDSKL